MESICREGTKATISPAPVAAKPLTAANRMRVLLYNPAAADLPNAMRAMVAYRYKYEIICSTTARSSSVRYASFTLAPMKLMHTSSDESSAMAISATCGVAHFGGTELSTLG